MGAALQGAARYHQHQAEVAGGLEVAASTTAGAGLINVCTLPAVANLTNYLTYFVVTCGQVGSVVSGTITLSGVIGGPLTYIFVETVSAGGYLPHAFRPPLPATAPNTAITVTLAAIGGGTSTAIVMTGWLTGVG